MLRVITTRAWPIAAIAVIDASPATCRRLSAVRNWGATSVTSAPITSITTTRLSSRWRATAPTSDPRGAPPARTVAAIGSATGRPRSGPGRDRLHRDAAGRRVHHGLLGGLGARDLRRDPALVEDEDPVGHREDLGQVAGDQQDRQPLRGEVRDDPVD